MTLTSRTRQVRGTDIFRENHTINCDVRGCKAQDYSEGMELDGFLMDLPRMPLREADWRRRVREVPEEDLIHVPSH
jgi:hypothetical protein